MDVRREKEGTGPTDLRLHGRALREILSPWSGLHRSQKVAKVRCNLVSTLISYLLRRNLIVFRPISKMLWVLWLKLSNLVEATIRFGVFSFPQVQSEGEGREFSAAVNASSSWDKHKTRIFSFSALDSHFSAENWWWEGYTNSGPMWICGFKPPFRLASSIYRRCKDREKERILSCCECITESG